MNPEVQSSTLIAALAVTPLLFAAPSSTAAEQTGSLAVGYRANVQYVRVADDEEDSEQASSHLSVTKRDMSLGDFIDLATSTKPRSFAGALHAAALELDDLKLEEIGNISELSLTVAQDSSSLASKDLPGGGTKILPSLAAMKLDAELTRYEKLEHDWDDAGGAPPSSDAIEIARAVLDLSKALGVLPKRTYVSPSGEVGLVWSKGNGYADLSFLGNGTISYYIRGDDGQHEEFSEHRVVMTELKPEVWSLLRTLS
jgi:hypothetical protein